MSLVAVFRVLVH